MLDHFRYGKLRDGFPYRKWSSTIIGSKELSWSILAVNKLWGIPVAAVGNPTGLRPAVVFSLAASLRPTSINNPFFAYHLHLHLHTLTRYVFLTCTSYLSPPSTWRVDDQESGISIIATESVASAHRPMRSYPSSPTMYDCSCSTVQRRGRYQGTHAGSPWSAHTRYLPLFRRSSEPALVVERMLDGST